MGEPTCPDGAISEAAGRCGYAAAMSTHPRRRGTLSTFAAVLVLGLLLAGVADAGSGDPRRAITKADQAKARSVVLRLADLGAGFVARSNGPDGLPPGVRCGPLSESDLTITGDAESPDFTLNRPGTLLTVGSSAQVYRTLREANASWARSLKPAALTCIGDIVRKAGGKGQTVKVLSVKRLAFPQVSEKTMAFRVVARVTSGATAVKVYFDAIILQQGRVQAGIVVTSALQPVGSTDEAALAGLVAARVQRVAGSGGSGPSA
jgi:hypothetical protein